MSYEFTDSELFILGALLAASNDTTKPFYAHARDLFGTLGLWEEPDTEGDADEPLQRVPADIIWATAESPGDSSRLSATDVATQIESARQRLEDALAFLEARSSASPDLVRELREGVLAFSRMSWMAFGFAPSTPSAVYGLRGDGQILLVKHVAPLPQGLVRLLITSVSPFAAMPLGWLMAIPDAFASVPQDVIADIVPSLDTGECVIGRDHYCNIQDALKRLATTGSEATPFLLGSALWSLRASCDCLLHDSEDSPLLDAQESLASGVAEIDGDAEADNAATFPDDTPELLKFLISYAQLPIANDENGRVPEIEKWAEHRHALISRMENDVRGGTKLAGTFAMPNVELLLRTFGERLTSHGSRLQGRVAMLLSHTQDTTFWIESRTQISNTICIAYGELLLRERHAPDPIPTSRTKTEVLRLPGNLRQLMSMAITHLRRDAAHGENSVVAMTLLVPVIEPLVRQAAERYLPECRSIKVAEILHTIRTEASQRTSPDREEMEVLARVGIALHHGFRNDTVHNVANIAGDWESAQFMAFGLLSMLNVLDRARDRMA